MLTCYQFQEKQKGQYALTVCIQSNRGLHRHKEYDIQISHLARTSFLSLYRLNQSQKMVKATLIESTFRALCLCKIIQFSGKSYFVVLFPVGYFRLNVSTPLGSFPIRQMLCALTEGVSVSLVQSNESSLSC